MSIKSLKLLLMICSSVLIFINNSNCYSMEEYHNNINDLKNNNIINENQNNQNSKIAQYKKMQVAELPKLNIFEEAIKQSFTKYDKCMWYKELIDTIKLVKTCLTENVLYSPISLMKEMYIKPLKKYIEQIILLPSILWKYGHLIDCKQGEQLLELAHLYKRVYNAIMTVLQFKYFNMIPIREMNINEDLIFQTLDGKDIRNEVSFKNNSEEEQVDNISYRAEEEQADNISYEAEEEQAGNISYGLDNTPSRIKRSNSV